MENKSDITFFAKTNFRNREVPFGIKTDDRRRHMYVIGKTGMGKTTLLENMVIQDIRNNKGVAFIDPNGDSVQKILDFIPPHRINDVIYFNPADLEFPIAFNILEAVETRYKHLVASGLMGVFTKIWANMWSSRMEYILNNTILALLESPGNTMLGITRMYVDKKYRKKIVDNVKDPMVRAFWVDEFANYQDKFRTEAVAPIQNKVGQFLSSGIIRNIVGQPKSTVDLRNLMDNKKVLLLDLSKGRVGEDNSALLGAMIITKLQLAAFSRADILEEERPDYYLYVDEFQNFVTDSFATILSEARKYRLNLIVGHQYIGQLTPDKNNTKVRDAIFGNVGTMVAFRVGAADAEFLEKEFEPTFTINDLINLPRGNVVLKLMINGVASEPFSAVTLPPIKESWTGSAQKVIKVSRERYANPVDDVEEKIARWMGAEFHEGTAALVLGQQGDSDEEMLPPVPQPPKAKEIKAIAANGALDTNNTEPKVNLNEEVSGKLLNLRSAVLSGKSDSEAVSNDAKIAMFNPSPRPQTANRNDRSDKFNPRRKKEQRPYTNENNGRKPVPVRDFRNRESNRNKNKSDNAIWDKVAEINKEKHLSNKLLSDDEINE